MNKLFRWLKQKANTKYTLSVISPTQKTKNFHYNDLTILFFKIGALFIITSLSIVLLTYKPIIKEYENLSSVDMTNYRKQKAYQDNITIINEYQEAYIERLNSILEDLGLESEVEYDFTEISGNDIPDYKKINENFITIKNQLYVINDFLQTREYVWRHTPFGHPLRGRIRITSNWGVRKIKKYSHQYKFHYGVDYGKAKGEKIYATASGWAKKATWYKGGSFGRHVIIEHDFGYSTLYAHMKYLEVGYKKFVKKGDVIGYVGETGKATGPHLHYEVRLDDVPENPNLYTAP